MELMWPPRAPKRLGTFSNDVFALVSTWAQSSPKVPLLDLGLGLIEHNPPPYLQQAYKNSLSKIDINQYGPVSGLPELRQCIADTYSSIHKCSLSAEREILIHTGAHEALLAAFLAFLDEGDEVILLEPAFPLYRIQIEFSGGVPVYVPLRAGTTRGTNTDSNAWKLDIAEFEEAFTAKTKIVVVNTPHNPLGKVFDEHELREIGQVCVRKNVVILADEVYEYTSYSENPIARIAALSSSIREHTLSIGSVGKAFNATGWRVGWMIGNERLLESVKLAHIALSHCAPGPPQAAAITGFRDAERQGFWRSNRRELQDRMSALCAILDDVGLAYAAPHSAYFLLVSTERLELPESVHAVQEIQNRSRDYKVCWWLIHEFGIVTIPGSAFYGKDNANQAENLLRVVACKNADNLRLARDRFLQLGPHMQPPSQA